MLVMHCMITAGLVMHCMITTGLVMHCMITRGWVAAVGRGWWRGVVQGDGAAHGAARAGPVPGGVVGESQPEPRRPVPRRCLDLPLVGRKGRVGRGPVHPPAGPARQVVDRQGALGRELSTQALVARPNDSSLTDDPDPDQRQDQHPDTQQHERRPTVEDQHQAALADGDQVYGQHRDEDQGDRPGPNDSALC